MIVGSNPTRDSMMQENIKQSGTGPYEPIDVSSFKEDDILILRVGPQGKTVMINALTLEQYQTISSLLETVLRFDPDHPLSDVLGRIAAL